MMSIAQASNNAMDNLIAECRKAIGNIDSLILDTEVFSTGEIDCLNIVKQNLRNRITVYEAAICKVH